MRLFTKNEKVNNDELLKKDLPSPTSNSSLRSVGSSKESFRKNNKNHTTSLIKSAGSPPKPKNYTSTTTNPFETNDTNPFNPFNPFSNSMKRHVVVTPSPKGRRTIVPRSFRNVNEILTFLRKHQDNDMDVVYVESMCRQIVSFMQVETQNIKVQIDGCKALFLLTFEGGSSDRAGLSTTCDGVEAILEAMESFPDDEQVQTHACVALEALSTWEENQVYLLAHKGTRMNEVFDALETFPDSLKLQIAGIGILKNVSSNPEAHDKTIALQLANSIPSILTLLKTEKDNLELYEKGCSTLAQLTEDNEASQLLLCNSQDQLGIRLAVDALRNKRFVDHQNIQQAAMWILQHVSSNVSIECKGRIIQHGGLDVILDTLKEECSCSYQGNDGALFMASAMQTLAHLSESKSSPHIMIKQKLGTAVPVILKVLDTHPQIAQVQVTGYTALNNLADVHSNLVTSNNGISIIMKSMVQQAEHPAVQKKACQTLLTLLSKSHKDAGSTNNLLSGGRNPSAGEALDLVRAIAAVDGLAIIFSTVRMHQRHRAVQEAAFGALYYLSTSRDLTPNQKHQLCLEENVFVLLGTMNSYIESETLCENGTGLILNMTFFSPLSQAGMASVGGIRTVLAAMRRHGLNENVQEYGSGILSGLCMDVTTHDEFISEEGISTVLAAMMVHPYRAGVQAFGCDVLASVASSSPSNKQMVIDGNAGVVANDAMVRHKKHKGVQNRGAALLKAIS
jgi:hypothetical protein